MVQRKATQLTPAAVDDVAVVVVVDDDADDTPASGDPRPNEVINRDGP
jgi:hypothetical protein